MISVSIVLTFRIYWIVSYRVHRSLVGVLSGGGAEQEGQEMSAGLGCRRFPLRLYLEAALREHFIYS